MADLQNHAPRPSDEAWDAYLKSLFSPLPGLREMALLEIPVWHGLGRDVTGLLEMSLRDTDPMVCRAAAMVTGRLRLASPTLLEELEKRLATDDDILKRTVVTTLSRLTPDSIPLMVRLLVDRDAYLRRFVAVALEDCGEQAVAPLVAVLSQDLLRRSAGAVLAKIGQPAIPHLLKLIDQPDRDLAYIAMDILEEIGPHVIPTLIEEIRFGKRNEEPGGDAVTRFGPSALPNLLSSLRDPDIAHRCWAAATLVKMGPVAVPALTGVVCEGNPAVCWLAGKALARIGAPAVPSLLAILGTKTRSLRWIAADILAQIGEEAIASLEHTILDGDPAAKEAAIHALGLMGEPAWSALSFLTECHKRETDPHLQEALREAMEKLAVFQ
ncbi:MAG: HEAT repeat domain-containing protein [Candidatus Riflebacteria bacterium]|nr:HEAT repeat domain-containing protein [Candidatus Riflebacteria bacterium]